jgi:hypothetical protein
MRQVAVSYGSPIRLVSQDLQPLFRGTPRNGSVRLTFEGVSSFRSHHSLPTSMSAFGHVHLDPIQCLSLRFMYS